MADYETAAKLADECDITSRTLMAVRVDDQGRIERLTRPSSADPYPEFTVAFKIRPTSENPSYEIAAQFPWIDGLDQYEPSVLPTSVPEAGNFVPAKHYQKDFVVRE